MTQIIKDKNAIQWRKLVLQVIKTTTFTRADEETINLHHDHNAFILMQEFARDAWLKPMHAEFVDIYREFIDEWPDQALNDVANNFETKYFYAANKETEEYLSKLDGFFIRCQKLIDEKINGGIAFHAYSGLPPGSKISLAKFVASQNSGVSPRQFFERIRVKYPEKNKINALKWLLPGVDKVQEIVEDDSSTLNHFIRGIAASVISDRMKQKYAATAASGEIVRPQAKKNIGLL